MGKLEELAARASGGFGDEKPRPRRNRYGDSTASLSDERDHLSPHPSRVRAIENRQQKADFLSGAAFNPSTRSSMTEHTTSMETPDPWPGKDREDRASAVKKAIHIKPDVTLPGPGISYGERAVLSSPSKKKRPTKAQPKISLKSATKCD